MLGLCKQATLHTYMSSTPISTSQKRPSLMPPAYYLYKTLFLCCHPHLEVASVLKPWSLVKTANAVWLCIAFQHWGFEQVRFTSFLQAAWILVTVSHTSKKAQEPENPCLLHLCPTGCRRCPRDATSFHGRPEGSRRSQDMFQNVCRSAHSHPQKRQRKRYSNISETIAVKSTCTSVSIVLKT